MMTISVEVWNGSGWVAVERGIPNLPVYWVKSMEQVARSYPGRRVRAVDDDGRLIDLIA
jgi:hypothetical protein